MADGGSVTQVPCRPRCNTRLTAQHVTQVPVCDISPSEVHFGMPFARIYLALVPFTSECAPTGTIVGVALQVLTATLVRPNT